MKTSTMATLTKLQGLRIYFGISPSSLQKTARRYCAASDAAKCGRDAASKGVEAAMEGGQQVKKEAASAVYKVKGVAGTVGDGAHSAAEKMKQTADEAWSSTKNATQIIKDTVAGEAEATSESTGKAVRKQAAKIERCMNTKTE